jgi:hypothetical protein
LKVIIMVGLDIAFVVELKLHLGKVPNFSTGWTPGAATAPPAAAGLVDARAAAPPSWRGLKVFFLVWEKYR